MTEQIPEIPYEASLWRLVVEPIDVKEETESGLAYTKETIQAQQYARFVGRVLSIGELAFTDQRFISPGGKRVIPCKVGDWIAYSKNAGIEVYAKVGTDHIRSLRIINDDQIMSVVTDIDNVEIPLPRF